MPVPAWINELADVDDQEWLGELDSLLGQGEKWDSAQVGEMQNMGSNDLRESLLGGVEDSAPAHPNEGTYQPPEDYEWTPPEITPRVTTTLTPQEEWSVLEKFENKLTDFKRDQFQGADSMYQAIESGEVDPTDARAGTMPDEIPVDMGFQQEMTTPNWLQRNVLRAKPKPTGQRPDFSMFSDEELETLEQKVQEVEKLPMQDANAQNVADKDLPEFLENNWGIKPAELYEGELEGLTPGMRPQPIETLEDYDEFAAEPMDMPAGDNFNDPYSLEAEPMNMPTNEVPADLGTNLEYIQATETTAEINEIVAATEQVAAGEGAGEGMLEGEPVFGEGVGGEIGFIYPNPLLSR